MKHAAGPVQGLIVLMSANWLRTILLMLVGFALAPLQIMEFGFLAFGLLLLVQQVTNSLATPIRTATAATLLKSLAEEKKDETEGRIRVFTNGFFLLSIVATVFLILSVLIGAFAPHVINIPPDLVEETRIAIVCEAVVIAFLLITSPWHAVLLHEGKSVAYNVDLTIRRWLDLGAFGIALLPFGWNTFIAFVVIRAVMLVVQSMARIPLARRSSSCARIRPSLTNRSTMNDLSRLGTLSAAQPFCNFTFFVADNYLLNILFGPALNGIYGIVTLLRGYARRLGSEVYQGTEALASDLHAKQDHGQNEHLMLMVVRVTSGIMFLSTMVIIVFFEPLIDLWLGGRLESDEELNAIMPFREAVEISWLMLVILVGGGILLEAGTAASKFLFGMGLVRRYAGILVTAGCLKLAISISIVILLKADDSPGSVDYWNSIWLPVGTLFVQVIFFGIVLPLRIVKLTSVTWSLLATNAILRPLLTIAIPSVVALLFLHFLEPLNWYTLIGSLFATGVVSLPSIFFFLLKRSERERVVSKLKKRRSNSLPEIASESDGS